MVHIDLIQENLLEVYSKMVLLKSSTDVYRNKKTNLIEEICLFIKNISVLFSSFHSLSETVGKDLQLMILKYFLVFKILFETIAE